MKLDRSQCSASAPVRIGIIGCGNVMDGAYMPLIQRLQLAGKAVVTAASHSSRARCQPLLAKWRIPVYHARFQDLCASPDVDLVVILTPMRLHARMARAALAAGKHVLLEKPLADNVAEARALLALAKRKRRLLVCAPFVTLSPTFNALRAQLVRGAIGKVALARARYGWAGPDWSTWFYRKGGGPIFDLAVYSLTSLTGLLGSVRRVTALCGTVQPVRYVNGRRVRVRSEDSAQILLEFAGGCRAVVTSGFTMQKYRTPALELYGTEGTLQLLGDDWAPEGYELWRNAVDAWQCFPESDPQWQWASGLVHLVECLRTGTRPALDPAQALHVLEIMLAAKRAAASGRAQRLRTRYTLARHLRGPRGAHAGAPAGAAHVEAAHRQHDRRR